MRIDLRQELQNYQPINLDSVIDGRSISDNMKNSIILYNKALDNLKSGSEDIAIIELKKAVSMNQEFYEANNLLGLCYLYINEHSKASELFKRVMQGEKNGAKALEYLNLLDIGDDLNSMPKKEGQKTSRNRSQSIEKGKPSEWSVLLRNLLINGDKFYIKYLIGFILGGLSVFLIVYLMFFINRPVQPLSDNSVTDLVYEKSNSKKPVTDSTVTISPTVENNEDFIKLKNELDEAKKEIDYYKGIDSLSQIETMYSERKYEDVADKLLAMKNMKFKDEAKAKYDELTTNVYPRASWAVYQEGKQLYNAGDYEGALKKLKKLVDYGGKWDYTADSYYSIGRCYMETKDYKSSAAMFEKVKSEYPESYLARESEARISEMQQ